MDSHQTTPSYASDDAYKDKNDIGHVEASNGPEERTHIDSPRLRPRFSIDNAWLRWAQKSIRMQPWEVSQTKAASLSTSHSSHAGGARQPRSIIPDGLD